MKPIGTNTRAHGERGGDHREADLARARDALPASSSSPLLELPVDALEHDDGVVDHETDGERERHQRHVVEREAEARRRSVKLEITLAGIASEAISVERQLRRKHEHHGRPPARRRAPCRRSTERDLLLDDARVVARDGDLDTRAVRPAAIFASSSRIKRAASTRSEPLCCCTRAQRRARRSGARCSRSSAMPSSTCATSRSRIGRPARSATISSPNSSTRARLALGRDGPLPARALDASARQLGVLAPQRVRDVLDREPVAREPQRIEPDAHLALARADGS